MQVPKLVASFTRAITRGFAFKEHFYSMEDRQRPMFKLCRLPTRKEVMHVKMWLLHLSVSKSAEAYQQASTASHCNWRALAPSSCISGAHRSLAPCTPIASTTMPIHSCAPEALLPTSTVDIARQDACTWLPACAVEKKEKKRLHLSALI